MAISALSPKEAASAILGAHLFRLVAERRVGRAGNALTRLQRYVLMAVSQRGSLSVSDLVELMEVGPTTASQFIKTLEERGWLARALDVRDRRRHVLSVTDVGRQILDQAEHRDRERLERLLARLTPEERGDLVRLTQRIVAIAAASPDLFRGDPEP